MFKIAFQQMFDNFNVNLRKNEGFLTCIPCIPIPEYGQSNASLDSNRNKCTFVLPVSILFVLFCFFVICTLFLLSYSYNKMDVYSK